MRYACKCAAANVAATLQVRADLNVPLDKEQKITDDTRIRAAIPTLKYLLDNGARVLLTSHLVSRCFRHLEPCTPKTVFAKAAKKSVM